MVICALPIKMTKPISLRKWYIEIYTLMEPAQRKESHSYIQFLFIPISLASFSIGFSLSNCCNTHKMLFSFVASIWASLYPNCAVVSIQFVCSTVRLEAISFSRFFVKITFDSRYKYQLIHIHRTVTQKKNTHKRKNGPSDQRNFFSIRYLFVSIAFHFFAKWSNRTDRIRENREFLL